jgi:hypothetical protein
MDQNGCIRDWLLAEALLTPEVRHLLWAVPCLMPVDYAKDMELVTEYIDR